MYFSNIANDKLKEALLFSFPRSSLISPTLSPITTCFLAVEEQHEQCGEGILQNGARAGPIQGTRKKV